MKSIHTTKQENYHKNNTPYRVIHQHRTKLGNPIRSIIVPSITIPICIIALLSLPLLSSILSSSNNNAYADGTVDFNVNVAPFLELSVPESIDLNLAPSSTNDYASFGTTNLNISAGTNNPYGYTLTMSVPDTNLTNSSVKLANTNNPNNIPLDSENHPIIPTITSTYTDNNFPANAWGYKIGGTNYSPISSSIPLPSTESAGNAITTILNLAAKVDNVMPAGSYGTILSFITVVNTPPVTFSQAFSDAHIAKYNNTDYYAMQDMTSAICAAVTGPATTTEDISTQLIDTRDNKVYWVSKLLDGNCWMTQNLDHDINSNRTYTPLDTDIKANWKPDFSTHKDEQWTGNLDWVQSIDPESYDPGDICWNGNTDGNPGDNQTPCASSNMHYSVGNYYNWAATVATNRINEYLPNETDVNQSVCPAGWTLPKGGSEQIGPSSFYDLTAKYGRDGNFMPDNQAMWESPLYFVPAGRWIGYFDGFGFEGDYWSSVIFWDVYPAFLYFYPSFPFINTKAPENELIDGLHYMNSTGFSVRCVAR